MFTFPFGGLRWGVGVRLGVAVSVVLLAAGCAPVSDQTDVPAVAPSGSATAAPTADGQQPDGERDVAAGGHRQPTSPTPSSTPAPGFSPAPSRVGDQPVSPTPATPGSEGEDADELPGSSDGSPDEGGAAASEEPEEVVEEPTSTDPVPSDGGQPADDTQTDNQTGSRAGAEQEADGSVVLGRGDSGPQVAAVQQQLSELGYWVGPTVDGEFGSLTEQAVLAFQGWEGLVRDGQVGPNTREALVDAVRPQPTGAGDLLEVHLGRQVLLVVADGRTEWVLHTSTGSGKRYVGPSGREAVADTPVGDFDVSWRVDGWRKSDLGRLWRPVYFHSRGIAVHGYPSVPSYPASHGCVRVPMAAMDMLWYEQQVDVGTRVTVVAADS